MSSKNWQSKVGHFDLPVHSRWPLWKIVLLSPFRPVTTIQHTDQWSLIRSWCFHFVMLIPATFVLSIAAEIVTRVNWPGNMAFLIEPTLLGQWGQRDYAGSTVIPGGFFLSPLALAALLSTSILCCVHMAMLTVPLCVHGADQADWLTIYKRTLGRLFRATPAIYLWISLLLGAAALLGDGVAEPGSSYIISFLRITGLFFLPMILILLLIRAISPTPIGPHCHWQRRCEACGYPVITSIPATSQLHTNCAECGAELASPEAIQNRPKQTGTLFKRYTGPLHDTSKLPGTRDTAIYFIISYLSIATTFSLTSLPFDINDFYNRGGGGHVWHEFLFIGLLLSFLTTASSWLLSTCLASLQAWLMLFMNREDEMGASNSNTSTGDPMIAMRIALHNHRFHLIMINVIAFGFVTPLTMLLKDSKFMIERRMDMDGGPGMLVGLFLVLCGHGLLTTRRWRAAKKMMYRID